MSVQRYEVGAPDGYEAAHEYAEGEYVKYEDYQKLEAKLERLKVQANTLVGCYERNPGNFAAASRDLLNEINGGDV